MATTHAIESVVAFRKECIWLQSCFNTFCSLFESGDETSDVLKRSAASFFRDINLIIQEHFILQVCRITDPAMTRGRENLTVKNIDAILTKENLLTPEIAATSKRLHSYRDLIDGARNRIVSHADKETLLSGQESGAHARKDVEEFLEALHAYVNLAGEAVGEGPLDFTYTGSEGDVEDLLVCLKRGLTLTSSGPPTAAA